MAPVPHFNDTAVIIFWIILFLPILGTVLAVYLSYKKSESSNKVLWIGLLCILIYVVYIFSIMNGALK